MGPSEYALFIVLFLGSIVSVIAGGGLGIILLAAFSFVYDIRTTVVMISMLSFTILLSKLYHFWRHINWVISFWILLLGIPAAYFGATMLFVVPEQFISSLVGVLGIGFVCAQWQGKMPKVSHHPFFITVLGGITGFISGLIGIGAVTRLPLLLSLGLEKEKFIATSAFIAFVAGFVKLVTYMQHFTWTEDLVHFQVIAVPIIILGIWVGKYLLQYIKRGVFEKLLLCVIFISAVQLLL